METVDTEEYKGYKINIYREDYPENPREWGGVATFVCSHRRYELGDRQDMDDCIDELFYKYVDAKNVVAYFIESRNARFVRNGTENYDGPYDKYLVWYDNCVNDIGLDDDTPDEDLVYNYIGDMLTNDEKLMLVEDSGNVAILTISAYEHDGICLWLGSTEGHPDAQWDCSTIGFAYVEKEVAEKEGMLSPGDEYNNDWKEWAYLEMDKEMEVYDAYVQGDVFRYTVDGGEDDYEDSGCNYYGYNMIKAITRDAKHYIDYHLNN